MSTNESSALLEYTDVFGHFHFYSGNIQLELWEEFVEQTKAEGHAKADDRTWRVESGDRVVFDNRLLEFDWVNVTGGWISTETLLGLCDSLNELLKTRWPLAEKPITAEGKLVFYHHSDHDVVTMIRFSNGAFTLTSYDFND